MNVSLSNCAVQRFGGLDGAQFAISPLVARRLIRKQKSNGMRASAKRSDIGLSARYR